MSNTNIVKQLDYIIEHINHVKFKIQSTKKYINVPKFPDVFDETEQLIIQAMLQGYVTDKDIEIYFESINYVPKFNLKYKMPTLYSKYNCLNRWELLRKFITIFR